MKLFNISLAALFLIGSTLAAVVPVITESAGRAVHRPNDLDAGGDHVNTHVVVFPNDGSVRADTSIEVAEAIPTATLDCAHTWCQDGISMCIYWAGVTGWDVSRGPVPGMTHTTLEQPCGITESPISSSVSDYQDISDQESTTTRRARGPGSATLGRLGPSSTSDESQITEGPVIPTDTPCHHLYCEDGTYYCHYWGGITAYDEHDNPLPGMTSTSIGPCSATYKRERHPITYK